MMASIRERVGRLEGRMNVVVDRRAIERDARFVRDKIEGMASEYRKSGRPHPNEAESTATRANLAALKEALQSTNGRTAT